MHLNGSDMNVFLAADAISPAARPSDSSKTVYRIRLNILHPIMH